jgi:hypothetical protein
MSLSEVPLLMTSLRRWVPASGAIVKPVLRTRRICSAMRSFRLDGRREESESEVRSSWKSSMRSAMRSATDPYSPEFKEVSETSSKPVRRRLFSRTALIDSGERSRTGR